MLVRARRSAVVRTKLDREAVLERVSRLAREGAHDGPTRGRAHGFFEGGRVADDTFDIAYRFNNRKNPQVYAIHGRVEDTDEWRIVHLEMTADTAWPSLVEISVGVVIGVVYVIAGGMPPLRSVAAFLTLMALFALANLVLVPAGVRKHVSSIVARQLDGTVVAGREARWPVGQRR